MVKLQATCPPDYLDELGRCFKQAQLTICRQLSLAPFSQKELIKMRELDIDAHTDVFWVSCEGKSHQVRLQT